MRSSFLLTCQLSFTLACLGACAEGAHKSSGHSGGSPDDSSVGGIAGGDNAGGAIGGDQGQGGAGVGGAGAGGVNQGGNASGGAGAGGANQGGNGAGGAGGGDASGGAGGGPGPGDGKGLFEAPNPWTKNVSALDKDPASDSIIQWLDAHGGWGGGKMKIDFGITVLQADNSTPKKQFQPTGDFFNPDCDLVPFPLPNGGAIEAENGYECTQDGDCHLIVVHKDEKKLYEMWRANVTGGVFYGGCAAVWDLTKTYPDNLRGEGCTSADAGGFPVAAMLFTPQEVKAGVISHAIRFILPNERIRHLSYVHPGSHSTFATSGGSNAPPYGVRFRLRKDFPMQSLPSDGARVIAKAMQDYGMFLADGGTIALTGASDKFSPVTWDDVAVDPNSMSSIQVKDMEVVDMGTPIQWAGSCIRN
jgi:serine/threonine-protein kinase